METKSALVKQIKYLIFQITYDKALFIREKFPDKVGLVGSNFIAGRPKAALLFWFFGGFRCGVPLFIVMLVIY